MARRHPVAAVVMLASFVALWCVGPVSSLFERQSPDWILLSELVVLSSPSFDVGDCLYVIDLMDVF